MCRHNRKTLYISEIYVIYLNENLTYSDDYKKMTKEISGNIRKK